MLKMENAGLVIQALPPTFSLGPDAANMIVRWRQRLPVSIHGPPVQSTNQPIGQSWRSCVTEIRYSNTTPLLVDQRCCNNYFASFLADQK